MIYSFGAGRIVTSAPLCFEKETFVAALCQHSVLSWSILCCTVRMTTHIQCVRSESPCASCLALSAVGFLSVLLLNRSSWRLAKNVVSNGNRDEIFS